MKLDRAQYYTCVDCDRQFITHDVDLWQSSQCKGCKEGVTGNPLVARYKEANIFWYRTDTGNDHAVQYGNQLVYFSGKNADIEASEEFGHCVLHYAQCQGRLD